MRRCTCHRRLSAALRLRRIHPDALDFAEQPSSFLEAREFIRRAEQARWALEVHRSNHPRMSAVDFARRIATAFDAQHNR
jgi:hypothetical protein